jgi:O-antigen ligase
MYFELAVPLAVVLAASSSARWQQIVAAAVAVTCSAAVALTLTRAGVVALGAACVVLLALAAAYRRRLRPLALPTILTGASTAGVVLFLALRLPDFDTRFGTENDWGWYAASYAAPDSLTLEQGAPATALVKASNTGQAVWTAGGEHAFALAYRWLSADASSQLRLPPTVVELSSDVRPGETVQLSVDVAASLPPGDYRLAWGMLQQRVLWFHDRGYPDAETSVHVSPSQTRPETATPSAIGQEPRGDTVLGLSPVARADLWRAALRMLAQRPLIGIGPDNFRHLYGAYLGLPTWDERVHANNLYLELLADVGMLGSAAFALVIAPAAVGLVRGLRAPPSELQGFWLAGLGASLVAFFVHGTLDYFLDFTPVYVLFWLIVGLSVSASRELDRC